MNEQLDKWSAEADKLGREHAISAASWCVDGNTSQEHIAKVIVMLNEGDPAVDYELPQEPNLSGEFADDLTPAKLYEQITGREPCRASGTNMDVLNAAYEDAVSETFMPECERLMRAMQA